MSIPKIVHQTFHEPLALPEVLRTTRLQLQRQNPHWEFRLYSDDDCFDFIRAHYATSVLAAYNAINPIYGAARADFFRYLLLYKMGGVYMDIKSSAVWSLDRVVSDSAYLLSHWDNRVGEPHQGWGMHFRDLPRGEFQQWHIACEPGHPFLKAVIEQVLHNIKHYTVEIFGVGGKGVLTTTGPIAYTMGVFRVMSQLQGNYRLVDTHHELGLCYSVYEVAGVSGGHQAHVSRRVHYSQITDPVVLR